MHFRSNTTASTSKHTRSLCRARGWMPGLMEPEPDVCRLRTPASIRRLMDNVLEHIAEPAALPERAAARVLRGGVGACC